MSQFHDLKDDPFFRLIEDSEWNACIGPQGHEEHYIDGYMEAAMYLCEVLFEKELLVSRDTLVLPILYNARHAIELALKFVLKHLHAEGVIREDAKANHIILEHFEQLKRAHLGDHELRSLVERLWPFVKSLAAIDADGQQLRYAVGLTGQMSLADRPLANLRVIHHSLTELGDVLKHLKQRTQEFCQERRTGSFTPQCSRKDLMSIAEELAKHTDRRTPEFAELRVALKKRYGLGNKTLLDAITAIESNREMGSLFGCEFSLRAASDEKIRFAVSCWSKRHPPQDPSLPRVRILRVEDVMREARDTPSSYAVGKELLAGVTLEELADIETVFYLSRDRYFVESYDQLFEAALRTYALQGDLAIEAGNLMSKTNFLRELSRGLAKLGRRTLAAEVWATRPDIH